MSGQEESNQSAFTQRADNAALKLKGILGEQLGINLPESKVQVGPDGRPPAPPPPEGSYAAMAQEAQDLAAQRPLPRAEEQTQQPDPAPEQPQEQVAEISQNAQNRIRELITQLREKDQVLQELQASQSQRDSAIAELQQRAQATEQQYQQLVERQLEDLDPEQRAAVLQDATLRQAVAESEQRILQTLMPQLEKVQTKQMADEYARLTRYAGYDPAVHPALIEDFRQANPNCSVEQAFRAVAEPEELATTSALPATPAPPVLSPGSGSVIPRSVPQPQEQSNPEAEMIEEAQRARDLRKSKDPREQKLGLKLFEQNLGRRIFGQ